MRAALTSTGLFFLAWLAPIGAAAQVVIIPLDPPCPPGVRCDASVSGTVAITPAPAPPSRQVVIGGAVAPPPAGGVVTVQSSLPHQAQAARPIGPVDPAPGTLQLAYLGGWDGIGVLSGGALRFTGHTADIFFVEVTLGVQGRQYDERRVLVEVPILIGLRLMGPIITPVLRAYGVLATGIAARALVGTPERAWGVFPVELGGGLELGAPVSGRMALGGFVDVRAIARVPFEQEPATLGVSWSAGFAVMWF